MMKRTITGFVKGGTFDPSGPRQADIQGKEDANGSSEEEEEGHHPFWGGRGSSRRTQQGTKGDENAPAVLYTELLTRPPEEPEVVVVRKKTEEFVIEDDEDDDVVVIQEQQEDDEVMIIEPPPRPRRRRRQEAIDQAEAAFDCAVCGERITSMTKQAHETSTLHIFNAKKQSQSRRIMLPDSNRGVQMLARMGWNEQRGLGRDEQGNVQPAKSILKLDRKGLGHKQPKARVTHFPAHDPEQALGAEDGKSEAERVHEEFEKAKAEERKRSQKVTLGSVSNIETAQEREDRLREERKRREQFRRELYNDVPEGYEEYFEGGDVKEGRAGAQLLSKKRRRRRKGKVAAGGGGAVEDCDSGAKAIL